MVCTYFLARVNQFMFAWISIKLGEWVRKDSFPLRDWTDSGKRSAWVSRASSREVVYPSLLSTVFSSLARVPVVCFAAHVLNSSGYLRWCSLDLFRVSPLPTCLLPLCFQYGLPCFFAFSKECLFFFLFFFFFLFLFFSARHSTFCVISSAAIVVSSKLHLSRHWRIEFSSPPPPMSLCHPIHSSSTKPSICVICCFSLLLVLGRFKEGQVVKGSSAFLFWSRLSGAGTVSLGCRCGKKIGSCSRNVQRRSCSCFLIHWRVISSSHTLECFLFSLRL